MALLSCLWRSGAATSGRRLLLLQRPPLLLLRPPRAGLAGLAGRAGCAGCAGRAGLAVAAGGARAGAGAAGAILRALPLPLSRALWPLAARRRLLSSRPGTGAVDDGPPFSPANFIMFSVILAGVIGLVKWSGWGEEERKARREAAQTLLEARENKPPERPSTAMLVVVVACGAAVGIGGSMFLIRMRSPGMRAARAVAGTEQRATAAALAKLEVRGFGALQASNVAGRFGLNGASFSFDAKHPVHSTLKVAAQTVRDGDTWSVSHLRVERADGKQVPLP
jgi:hypothetical protein